MVVRARSVCGSVMLRTGPRFAKETDPAAVPVRFTVMVHLLEAGPVPWRTHLSDPLPPGDHRVTDRKIQSPSSAWVLMFSGLLVTSGRF